jgi:MtN3 and saliva related transmembrane protein
MSCNKLNWIGYVAAIIGIIGTSSQIVKTIKMKESRDLSLIFLLLGLCTSILWFVHGIANKVKPAIVSGILDILLAFTLVYLKFKYNGKK